ncbi:MAG: CBS domain-containing protein [Alphaproteobacteria bacterium]
MNAADIMARSVVSVTPETTVAEAARLMLDHRISGMPVLDRGGALVGIISEGDLLRRAETGTERRRSRWLEFFSAPGRLAQDYAQAHACKIADIMTRMVITIGPGMPIAEIVDLIERRRVKRLPVIADGRLVGIVTRADLVRAFVDSLPPAPRAVLVPDAEIRDSIKEEIAKQPWARRASIEVHVVRGEVELRGTVTEERARAALQVIAENVAGVRRVRHRFVWSDDSLV